MAITKDEMLHRLPQNIAEFTYPCQCVQCRKPTRRRIGPIEKPLEDFMPPSVTKMVELALPLGCSGCSRRDTTRKWSPAANPDTYYSRAVAFLYRLMTFNHDDPDQLLHIRRFIDRCRSSRYIDPWLPVPISTFFPILAPTPRIASDLKRLSRLSRLLSADYATLLETSSLSSGYGYETWHLPPSRAVNDIEVWVPEHENGIKDYAKLCSSPGALTHEDLAVRTIADRVVFNPNPLDYWPWVPGWAPAPNPTVTAMDHLDSEKLTKRAPGRPSTRTPDDLIIPLRQRRWWNWNPQTDLY